MRVCVCACVCACVCIKSTTLQCPHTHDGTHTVCVNVCIRVCVFAYACVYACACVCGFICVFVCMCLYMYMCASVCACVCACVCVVCVCVRGWDSRMCWGPGSGSWAAGSHSPGCSAHRSRTPPGRWTRSVAAGCPPVHTQPGSQTGSTPGSQTGSTPGSQTGSTPGSQTGPRRATASWSGAVRVRQRLIQGHLHAPLGGARDRTSNLLVTSRPPEPHAAPF